MIQKLFISIGAVAALAACAAGPRLSPGASPLHGEPLPPAPPLRLEERLAEAEAFYERGGFVHLRRAFAICQYLETVAPDTGALSGHYARTALVLAARAKEMGVRNDSYLAKARELVEKDASLVFLRPAVGIVEVMPVATTGVWDDGPDQATVQGSWADLEAAAAELMNGAPPEALVAYFRALLLEASVRSGEAVAGLDESLKAFPASLLLKFKRAVLSLPDDTLLEEVIGADPEFCEAFLARGRLALAGGALISAETDLLRAREGVPESPLVAILLAGVNFATEEYDRSLAFYEQTLAVAPEYKEALFGKAVALSFLGRPAEADLVAAVNMDSGETDAFFLLGKLYALQKKWPDSALNFELAAHGYEFQENRIREKIAQVEGASMAEDRKGRLLARKSFQLEKTRLTRATACFNAAAGYHNAGLPAKALPWARGAGAHSYFADKAKDLIALLTEGR